MLNLPDSRTGSLFQAPRRALFYSLCLTSMAVASPTGKAEMLFSENFADAEDGQNWASYPRWSAPVVTNPATIVVAHGQNMGKINSDSTTLSASFGSAYSLTGQGYRLSFDISGHLHRPLLVYLADSDNNRVGLQLGYTGSLYGIGGASQTSSQSYGSRSHYNPDTGAYGGYYSTSAAPANFNLNALYHATVDINGTAADLEIGGALLEAGKVRITYNEAGVGDMASFITIFDIPENLKDLSTLQVAKPNTGGGTWYLGNFELTSQAIPEPSTVAALVTGGVLLSLGMLRRKP